MKNILTTILVLYPVWAFSFEIDQLGKVPKDGKNWFGAGNGILFYKFTGTETPLISYIHIELEKYYSIHDENYLLSWDLKFKKKEEELLRKWPITRWEPQSVYPEYAERLTKYYQKPNEKYNYYSVPIQGCLSMNPLRYGDLETDGEKEVVLHIGSNLVVFSPKYENVIFAEEIFFEDALDAEQTLELNEDKQAGGNSPYYSESAALQDDPVHEPGFKGRSKLFQGDFDKDGNPDILIWRKLYQSNTLASGTPGFSLVRNEYQHYEKDLEAQKELENGITGEYLPQETNSDVVIGWLNSDSLTWQKGYPSKNECKGQEGQLIAEMHDPLLNDPDVLK